MKANRTPPPHRNTETPGLPRRSNAKAGSLFSGFRPISYLLSPIFFSGALVLCGCSSLPPLKGGRAVTIPKPGGLAQTLVQSENPSMPSRQDQETVRLRTYTLPLPSFAASSIQYPAASISPPASPSSIQYPASSIVSDFEQSRASTTLGAAQKDTARELSAKLSSLKSIVWVGLALFIFGIASFAWPPLKAIIGSVTTSAAITLGGLALIILPTLVVGHELLLLVGVAVGVGGWFLAHRHGRLHGELSATRRAQSFWNSYLS